MLYWKKKQGAYRVKFSEKCRRLRAERGWTQEELAQACFVSRSAVSKWETDAGYPDIENLKQLASLAGTTIDELISEEDLANRRQMDRRRGRLFYLFAVICLALTAAFTLAAYFSRISQLIYGSFAGVVGYLVFAVLTKRAGRSEPSERPSLPYLITRLVILLIVLGAIVTTIIQLK